MFDTVSKCPRCGNTDFNKMLVWYFLRGGGKGMVADCAPLPMFLFERKSGGPQASVPVTCTKVTCLRCAEEKRGEVEVPIQATGPAMRVDP